MRDHSLSCGMTVQESPAVGGGVLEDEMEAYAQIDEYIAEVVSDRSQFWHLCFEIYVENHWGIREEVGTS